MQKLRELSVDIGTDDKARQRDMMVKCAMTSMNSKLVRRWPNLTHIAVPLCMF